MEHLLVEQYLQPLVQRNLFLNEEDALKELLRTYIIQKINILTVELSKLEEKYQMNFSQFKNFITKKAEVLTEQQFTRDERKKVSAVFMNYEDDLLEWKAKKEILDSWLGYQKGVV